MWPNSAREPLPANFVETPMNPWNVLRRKNTLSWSKGEMLGKELDIVPMLEHKTCTNGSYKKNGSDGLKNWRIKNSMIPKKATLW